MGLGDHTIGGGVGGGYRHGDTAPYILVWGTVEPSGHGGPAYGCKFCLDAKGGVSTRGFLQGIWGLRIGGVRAMVRTPCARFGSPLSRILSDLDVIPCKEL